MIPALRWLVEVVCTPQRHNSKGWGVERISPLLASARGRKFISDSAKEILYVLIIKPMRTLQMSLKRYVKKLSIKTNMVRKYVTRLGSFRTLYRVVSNREMEKQAADYSNLNDRFQLLYGKRLVDVFELSLMDHVLDVGCGTGELAAYVAQYKIPHGKVTAIDPDEKRIAKAKQKFKDVPNISFHVGSSTEFLKGKNDVFDFAYSNFVLHWIPVPHRIATLESIYNALKPGGLTAHHIGAQMLSSIEYLIKTRVLTDDDEKWFTENIHIYSKEEFCKISIDVGFDLISMDYYIVESKFESLDSYLTWAEATHGGYIPLKKRYEKRNEGVDIKQDVDGSVIEGTSLIKADMKKPQRFFQK